MHKYLVNWYSSLYQIVSDSILLFSPSNHPQVLPNGTAMVLFHGFFQTSTWRRHCVTIAGRLQNRWNVGIPMTCPVSVKSDGDNHWLSKWGYLTHLVYLWVFMRFIIWYIMACRSLMVYTTIAVVYPDRIWAIPICRISILMVRE